jgi:hypothetical protein
MSLKNVHVDDYGFDITLTLSQEGVAEDISTYSTLQIILEKPDGTEVTKTAVFVTDGTDGQIKYAVETGVLDTAGQWYIWAVVSIAATAQITSDRIAFYVLENEDNLYITVEQMKSYLGISATNSADDNLLAEIIEAGQSMIETYTDKTFKVTADTTRYLDAKMDVKNTTLYLDGYLASITSITNGDGETIAASEYVTEPRNKAPYYGITLLLSATNSYWTYVTDPQDAIAIVGRWGFSMTPPNDIKMAMRRLCAYLYRQKDSGVFEVTGFAESGLMEIPMGLPKIVQQILAPYAKDYRLY